ncbi:helix-turn-helix transcriptional regulator [Knoellia subterranea]|uniref:HTH cro/C1-type domain-containing protein n=1 Tax=Knoellia subterranea KCTC 19937 TaxID=1385521 RepID=A0A0A0JJN1_9MICO|nr:helix-turn-helix transcriptional regulator [Knoellia subterranea]KGN36969.1 hypothetical protein N803_16265 [Knoellia subterranea KCTC 19937]
MAKHSIPIDAETRDALALLGAQIRIARHDKGWTVDNLAQRVGVSARTILAVESGAPTVAIGTAFSAALLVGVPLFNVATRERTRALRTTEQVLSLLPSRVDRSMGDDDDAF